MSRYTQRQWAAYERRKAARAADTMRRLTQPERYFTVSEEQLKRDLKGRTLGQIYAANKPVPRCHRTLDMFPR